MDVNENPEVVETPVEETTEKAESNELKEIEKLKRLLNNANSEAANYKKQLREKQTDDERKASEQEEYQRKIQEELEELRKERSINSKATRFVSMGMKPEVANIMAKSMHEGNEDLFFTSMTEFVNEINKQADARSMNNQKGLSVGNPINNDGVKTFTKEDINKMSSKEINDNWDKIKDLLK